MILPYCSTPGTRRTTITRVSLYSTTSRPFDPPETGKIAIKVINHYGGEVLEVYDIMKTTFPERH